MVQPDLNEVDATSVASNTALRTIGLLSTLSDGRLASLAKGCRWREVRAHHTLLQRTDRPGDVYFLIAGSVRVTTYSACGREISFRDLGAGDFFGEFAAIDGKARAADVVTLAKTLVASISKFEFSLLLNEEPSVARTLLVHATSIVRELSERVIALSTKEVGTRLHVELLRQVRCVGRIDQHLAVLDPAPLHEALASRISTSREQVTRELNALLRAGVLAKRGRTLGVDLGRLSALVEAA